MTVAELIEKLKTMPQDAVCLVDLVSSEGLLEVGSLEEVEVTESGDKVYLSGPDSEA